MGFRADIVFLALIKECTWGSCNIKRDTMASTKMLLLLLSLALLALSSAQEISNGKRGNGYHTRDGGLKIHGTGWSWIDPSQKLSTLFSESRPIKEEITLVSIFYRLQVPLWQSGPKSQANIFMVWHLLFLDIWAFSYSLCVKQVI